MADYYRILGIDPSANSTQIRTAYKKLAMTYHPDRNAGDKEAEEMFKTINEAYHVLSDPLKKSRYDARMNSYQTTINTEDYWRELQRQQYYRWKSSQRSYYRIDKNYFRIQGLAFLVFIILAGFCFGVIHTINYVIAEQHAKKWRENGKLLKQVTGLFGQEKFREAFTMINFLREQDPMEYRFGFTRDSLILELRNMADKRMAYQDFIGAVEFYQVLRNYERPPSLETLNKIASCQYYLGNYSESLVAMKHLHNQQPWNLELIYQIGMINLEKLDNKIEALHYFSMGKKLFKDNLSKVYGEAFEIIMDPTDAPDVYFDIFEARARTNIRLKDYEEAVTDCNWAVFLRPGNHEPYRLRAICKIELRNYNEGCIDLRKATFHGSRSVDELRRRFCQ